MKRSSVKVGIILLAGLLLAFIDLPAETQKELIPFTPQAILDSQINLGLDLQGGSQLDYKVDLRKVPELDKDSIVDGILGVINKRVNSLGVAEPNIYTSDIGEEKHLIVELAGIKDLEVAKSVVGKTIQLEFKEQKTEEEMLPDDELENQVKQQAQGILDSVLAGGDLKVLGQEEEQANPGKVFYLETPDFVSKDQVAGNIQEPLFGLEEGQVLDRLIDNKGNITLGEAGEFSSAPAGFHLVKVTEKRDHEEVVEIKAGTKVSHILIAYKDAQRAAEDITRTEEEAKTKAEEALAKVKEEGANFAEIAKEYSDEPGIEESGGALSEPVRDDEGFYVKEFEDAALALTEAGQISGVVESPFGYHVMRADELIETSSETVSEIQIKYIDLYFSATPDPWKETGLSGQHFVHADVEFQQQTLQPYVSILFNGEGGKLFAELTGRNVGKPIAIFVGGQLISAPNVNEKIEAGQAIISGQFTLEEANDLARDLNTGAIPAPIVLAGQYTIGATLGQDALSSSLFAGLLGLLLLALYMIFFYRSAGALATVALTIYSVILLFLIKIALPLGFALGIAIAVFAYLVSKILNSKDSGAEKAVSGAIVCFLLFFLTFILSTPIVLTLAGVAGIILSIGMAVDANILIFERVKEELRDGRTLGSAIEVGFERAWSSIRDSNFSSLITCGILFYFGSSIIQGFAFNLAAGILISMFTAITITKVFLAKMLGSRLAQSTGLFGKPKKVHQTKLAIIDKRRYSYWFSGVLLGLTLLGGLIFGLKLGLDFTGGTLMEFQFEGEVTNEQLHEGLQKSAERVNAQGASGVTAEVTAETPEEPETSPATGPATGEEIEEAGFEPIDLSKAKIIPSDAGFIIKAPHINADTHDLLIVELKKELGDFEETRFSTVGPTVGKSLQYRAVLAVLIAAVMIVLYVALAFRKVPRHIGKWRFGLSAIVALIHDLGIMLGVYVFLGLFLNVEIDALFITAMLTILGFSVHDTIVVFDRLREKVRSQARHETFEHIANDAVNETMARSLNTSITLLITLGMLAALGSDSIKFFVISLIVGVISGTYSSIFIATPFLVDWQKRAERKR